MSLALEKKKVLEQAAKAETKTAAQNKKNTTRVAHVPQSVGVQPPIVTTLCPVHNTNV